MKLNCVLILLFSGYVFGNLVNDVRIRNHVDYVVEVITETVKQIEEKEWCNLKVPDAQPKAIDELVFGWHAKGNVSYTNGFVVSMISVDVLQSSVNQQVNLTADAEAQGVLTGTLRMHDVVMGYDVAAVLEDGTRRYTATYRYPMINMAFIIRKIMNSDRITVDVVGTVANNQNILDFIPDDRLSDTLISLFDRTMFNPGIIAWASDVFQPIAATVITQVPFPEICYNCSA